MRRNHRQKGFTVIEVFLVIIFLTVIGIVAEIVVKQPFSKSPKASSASAGSRTVTSNNPSPSIPTQDSDNTDRKSDASAIAATVANYIDDNEGVLPQSTGQDQKSDVLDICGTSCSSGDVEATGQALSIYKPANVSFRNYSATLAVPDDQTVYIVDGAGCNNDGSHISANQNSRSVAILFALQDGPDIQPQCVEQ
jgi:cytoskeletal protein RodZ